MRQETSKDHIKVGNSYDSQSQALDVGFVFLNDLLYVHTHTKSPKPFITIWLGYN